MSMENGEELEARTSSPQPQIRIRPPLARRPSFGNLVREGEGEAIDLASEEIRRRKWKKRKKLRKGKMSQKEEETPIPMEIPPEEESKLESEPSVPEEEEVYTVLNGRSALIFPFIYKTDLQVVTTAFHVMDQLKKRTIRLNQQDIPLWKPYDLNLREIYDLSPLFRQVLGSGEKNRGPEKTWTCHRMIVNRVALEALFNEIYLHTIQNDTEVCYPAQFESIELLLYPRGASLLVFNINWKPPYSNRKLTLDDIRTIIYASRYKQIISGVVNGWGFPSVICRDEECSVKSKLGEELFCSKFFHKTTNLAAIGNWLLCLTDESTSHATNRVDQPRHALHHSTVVIDREPPSDTLQEYLFHLRRGFGQKNRPPPKAGETLGRVLVWRVNKYIAMAREGTVSMSWPIRDEPISYSFEVNNWHKKFQGVYLALALHAQAEKLVFEELSDLAANQAEYFVKDASFEQVQASRNQLRSLASIMTRYTLSMSSNDCGGTSEYSEFFTTLRQVYGIPDLRTELSGELKDVLAVVESNYLEEERRRRQIEEDQRRAKAEAFRNLQRKRDAHRQRFDLLVSIFSAITLPFVIVSGIFGMNLSTLPDVSFWQIMLITAGIAVVIFFVLVVIVFNRRYAARNDIEYLANHHSA